MQKHSSELNYARSSVYSLQYHLILVTKYRRDVLITDIKTELEELLKSMTEQFSGKIIEINIMPDHVHMLIDASPKHSISSMMKGYKGVSARMLFMHHPEIKEKLCGGHLWQPSYFACTVSERSEDMIREYIRKQKKSKVKGRYKMLKLPKTTEYIRVRRYRLVATNDLTAKFERNIEAKNKIYNYVLKYLEKTYGVKNLKRPYPNNKKAKLFLAKDVLIPKILKDLYGLSKWDGKKVGIHSQALRDEYLVSILTNFGEYRKNLISASKMSKQN